MSPTNQPLLKVLIGLVILAGTCATLMIIVSDSVAPGNGKLFAIAFSFIFYGITGTICWATARKSEHSLLGNAGMIISAVAFLFTTILIVGKVESTDMLKLGFCLLIASIAFAHISFLYYINARNNYASVTRVLATLFISLFSLLIIAKIFITDDQLSILRGPGETYIRMIFASLVLDLTTTLLVPLCNHLQVTTATELLLTSDPVATPNEPHL